MTVTIVGQVATSDGCAQALSLAPGRDVPRLVRNVFAAPADEYRSVQPPTIWVDCDHDGAAIGEVVYIERQHGRVTIVGVAGDELPHVDGDIYLSPDITSNDDGTVRHDIELHAVAITRRPGTTGLPPITVVPGDLRDVAVRATWSNLTPKRELLERAAKYDRARAPDAPHRIAEPDRQRELAAVGAATPLDQLVNQRARTLTPSMYVDEPVSVRADVRARLFVCRTPPGREPNARLVWSGAPVGTHHPDAGADGAGFTAFAALSTGKADEALVLAADGVLDTCSVRRGLRGTWRVAELT